MSDLPTHIAASCFVNFTGRPLRLHAVTNVDSGAVTLIPFSTDEELEHAPNMLPERVGRYVRGNSQHLSWAQSAFGSGMPLIGLVSPHVTNLEYVWHTASQFSGLKRPPQHAVMLRQSRHQQVSDRPSTAREGSIGLLNLSTDPQTLVVQPARVVPPLLKEPTNPDMKLGQLVDAYWHALPKGDHRFLPRFKRLAAENGWLVVTVDKHVPLGEDWSKGHPVFDSVFSWADDVLNWKSPPIIVLQPVTDEEAADYAKKPHFLA